MRTNLAVGAAIALDAADANHHAIAVHRLGCSFLGNIDVAFKPGDGAIGNDESVAVAMDAQSAGGEFPGRSGGDIMARFCFDDFAAIGEPLQLGFELRPRDAAARQLAKKLLQVRAPVRQTADMIAYVIDAQAFSILRRHGIEVDPARNP